MTRRKGKPGKVDEPALPPLPPLPSKGDKARAQESSTAKKRERE